MSKRISNKGNLEKMPKKTVSQDQMKNIIESVNNHLKQQRNRKKTGMGIVKEALKKKQEKPKRGKELIGHVNGRPLYSYNGCVPAVVTDEMQNPKLRSLNNGIIRKVLH